MPDRVTILLADEDALRRDGLAAVLSGTAYFEVLGGVPDGEAALERIRVERPDVAVVDLNLPRVHGIELVRRVRSESLGTKIIILAGTADDEIVREVVRAGGDGYLLKNGPARHLVDAISYVRDGGQYFSPQLRRDGRDRHLLEEPVRPPAELLNDPWPEAAAGHDGEDDFEAAPIEDRRPRPAPRSPFRNGRASRGAGRRPSDPANFRERLREDSESSNLQDRDYEIMTMMADGIRPVLDRLDEIDNRVAQMETGDAPIPTDPRGWLSSQLADTLRDARGGTPSGTEVAVLGRTVTDMEARLPELIEEAVTKRFHQMANKLQQEIEDTHVRTLETFVKNIQVKLVQRVSALENDMSSQAEAMNQLREYSQRTEDNLGRLISGVDRLAQELPRRLAAPQQQPVYTTEAETPIVTRPRKRRSPGSKGRLKIVAFSLAGVALLALIGWGASLLLSPAPQTSSSGGSTIVAAVPTVKSAAPAASTDTKTRMQAAQEYVDRKDYSIAEDIYKQIVKAEPNNVDALKALASVLYREDKIEESVSILDRIPK